MKRYVAEMIGTMTLVLFGCGAAAIAGADITFLGISIAFGLSIVAMAYAIGPISGCHINPAVTIGVLVAGRMKAKEAGMYIVFQIIGAFIGTIILALIMNGTSSGLGINIVQDGYTVANAAIFEVVFTFIFLIVILGVTSKGADNAFAGLAIGLTLTAIHLVGIPVDGTSVNPARSIAPALVTMDAVAMSQLWIFIIMPVIGGALAGLLYRFNVLTIDAE